MMSLSLGMLFQGAMIGIGGLIVKIGYGIFGEIRSLNEKVLVIIAQVSHHDKDIDRLNTRIDQLEDKF